MKKNKKEHKEKKIEKHIERNTEACFSQYVYLSQYACFLQYACFPNQNRSNWSIYLVRKLPCCFSVYRLLDGHIEENT